MKNTNDYSILYNEILKDSLNYLETERTKAKTKILKLGFVFGIIIFFSFLGLGFLDKLDFDGSGDSTQKLMIYYFVFLVLCLIIPLIISNNIISKYRKEFKNLIINKMVSCVNSNLKYIDEKYEYELLFKDLLARSQLFEKIPNEMFCDDFVVGKINDIKLIFCETEANYSNYFTEEYYNIFKGIFFCSDFNKKFKGKVVLLPNKVGYLKESILKLEDIEFNKKFVVYGDDEITSRYILSMSLMEKITKFCKDTNKQLYISFVDSKVYIGIPYASNLFEVRIFNTILKEDYIIEFYKCIELVVSIVEELNLNCNIWETSVNI